MLFMSCLAAGWKARCMDAFYHSFSDEKLLQYGNVRSALYLRSMFSAFVQKSSSILKELSARQKLLMCDFQAAERSRNCHQQN
jgi:hypothetical protein